MNWISRLTRPTVKTVNHSKNIPDNLWDTCPGCGAMLFHEELVGRDYICPHCDHYFPLPVMRRLEMLFDGGQFTVAQLPNPPDDPLKFTDVKDYTERLKAARKACAMPDALTVACGKMDNKNVVVGVFNFAFMGGSMGIAVGEAFLKAVQLALLQEAALIMVTSSGGARMQEGLLSLMQMARTTIGVEQLSAKKIPYIVVLTNPTTGGTTASLAMLGDITLAEPGAIIGFAGPRVIEQTMHTKLPENFQKSEFLYTHGMVDAVVPRPQIRDKIITVLKYLLP